MSHLYIVICLFAFAAYSISGQEGNDDEAIRRGNAYIDQLLKDMFDSDTDKFDPYEMEDSVVGFHKKIMFVNVTGEAKLYDGSLKGLSTLHRTDNCVLHEEGERLKVNAKLGAGVLNFLYKGSAKFMNFGPTITVHGDLAFVEVDIEFTVDAKTGKNGKLTKFMIDDMRDMRVWVTGLGPINWAVNPIIKAVTKIFKRILRYFLENRVQKYIDNRLPNYKFPVEGGGITDAPLTKPTEPEETTQTTEQELTTQTAEPETTTVELTTITPEPEVTTVEQTTVTTENEITTPELTSQPPEPDTITPTPEEPTTTVTEEPETQTSEIIETTATEEPETQTPEVTETPVPEEPETPAPEEPETPVPEEPETPVPEEPETPVPEEPDTPVPEEPETPVPEEPETPVPEEPETPPTEEPAEL